MNARLLATAVVILLAAGCATAPPPGKGYRVRGRTYVPLEDARGYSEVGLASWYGPGFHGKRTASGEIYDMYGPTAAHKLLPLGTRVRVTRLDDGRSVVARINDRGPFVSGRVIDLSYALADALGIVGQGTAKVRVEALEGPEGGPPPPQRLPGPFAWQVGAFTVEANARRLARTLAGEFDEVAVQPYDRGDVRFLRVRVGNYPARAEAERHLAALRARGFDPLLVRKDE
ncbi:MAG: septal ring lytic transglycosylase RlpA family protein [Deferrisomatales bacterium]